MPRLLIYIIAFIAFVATDALAQVTTYTNKPMWQSAVGLYSTITFQGFPTSTLIAEQYADLGVHFTDGGDFIHLSASYVNDGCGLRGGFMSTMTIEFDGPLHWIAMDFPGTLQIALYRNNQLFHTTGIVGVGGTGNFAGLTSTMEFDTIRVFNQIGGEANLDDFYFGPPIPTPSTLGVIVLATLFRRCRRAG